MKKKFQNFYLKIGLSSDSVIRSWSNGEVTKPETINYKTEKPVFSGLFCEKIFGPVKNNECACGKYRNIKNKGKVCEICEVMVTDSIVRRRRMGHIELDEPVVHIWYYKSIPSKLSAFLDLSLNNLKEIIYYRAYALVNNNSNAEFALGSLINLDFKVNLLQTKEPTFLFIKNLLHHFLKTFAKDSQNYLETVNYLQELETEESNFFVEEFIDFVNENSEFELATGGIAIEKLLKAVKINEEILLLKKKIKEQRSKNTDTKFLRRLEVLNNFANTGQKPEWMLTRTIPVLPPELRPIVILEGGRPAISGINRLYIELLIRKNRLAKIKERGAPAFMINELCNYVQIAVDNLFDNSLAAKNNVQNLFLNANIKSIASNLKGKTGRFRQNLLGKRVDYSAGSVIAGGPQLQLNECGLPRDIAIVLFTPAIIGKLLNSNHAINKKQAEKMIEERQPVVWDFLEEIIVNYPVILNRAPTLHRLGIQAFYPKLVRGKAILLHPLVTTAFNADFDGDRMPVHLPLTTKAKKEAVDVLMSDKNILNPRNGSLITIPTQDIILGIYYMTLEKKPLNNAVFIFPNTDQVLLAYWNRKITLHDLIFLPVSTLNKVAYSQPEYQKQMIITTAGKLLLNQVFPSDFPYLDGTDQQLSNSFFASSANLETMLVNYKLKKAINKSFLSKVLNNFLEKFDFAKTVEVLNKLKNLGFKYSTYSGTTISLFDLLGYETNKQLLFKKTEAELDKIRFFFKIGAFTKREKKAEKIKKWTKVKENVEQQLKVYFDDPSVTQPLQLMVNSGARGSISNFTQLVGMRGLMINTKGEVIDTPIKASLTEGLSPLEYYISTYGARKGMVDTALKTADSGYLTRRLVDATHDFYTTIDDCKTDDYLLVKTIFGLMDSVIKSLAMRIYGHFSAETILDKEGEIIITKNQLITREIAQQITDNEIKEVKIRSVLTCKVLRGVCCLCYGLDLSVNKLVKKWVAVGVLASQSIGEPATQLTMRTFHTGGVSDVTDITQGLPRVIELFDVVSPKGQKVVLSPCNGTVIAIEKEKKDDFYYSWHYLIQIQPDVKELPVINLVVASDSDLLVNKGKVLKKGDPIMSGSIALKDLLDVTNDPKIVANYIIEEIQKVYCAQGIDISDKYIEIIVKKMLSRSVITSAGDSQYVVGQDLENHVIAAENKNLLMNKQNPIVAKIIVSGIKTVATKTYSFLSASSFQETAKVLIQSAIENRIDYLYGLKENVIVGNLIPVGTGHHSATETKTNESSSKNNF